MEKKFNVTGMSCAACSARVEKSVSKLDGVCEVNVNLLKNTMKVVYDENLLTSSDIISAVESGGYGAYEDGQKDKKTDVTAKMQL